MVQNTLLDKLDALVIRFEEIGKLITDPEVIADIRRFVKLNKEYRDLEKIRDARNRYHRLLTGIEEAKQMLENESDGEWREMARTECDECT
jgi:peptide chain release factor 1